MRHLKKILQRYLPSGLFNLFLWIWKKRKKIFFKKSTLQVFTFTKEIKTFSQKPLIGFLIQVKNDHFIDPLLTGLKSQIYENWEAVIIASNTKKIQERIQKFNLNLKIKTQTQTNDLPANWSYVWFLRGEDQVCQMATYWLLKTINFDVGKSIFYTDVYKINFEGTIVGNHFKPDFSLETFLAFDFIGDSFIIKRKLLNEFKRDFSALGLFKGLIELIHKNQKPHHISENLIYQRAAEFLSVSQRKKEEEFWLNKKDYLNQFLKSQNQKMEAELGEYPGIMKIRRPIQGHPLISICIPFRDNVKLLKTCINSIEKSTYKNFELVLINNDSREKEIFQYKVQLLKSDLPVKWVDFDGSFNFSKINNFGVSKAIGEQVLLLNNDIEVINPDWLEAMLEYSQNPEVGAVGSKLYYFDGTIQHAGVIIGIGGVAGHSHKYIYKESPGYWFLPHRVSQVSAVTAACLMIKKALYEKVGGLDESLSVAYNDVDLCLRLHQMGYKNIFTPYSQCIHYESKSRGYEDTLEKLKRLSQETKTIHKKHLDFFKKGDPFYNKRLPTDREDYKI